MNDEKQGVLHRKNPDYPNTWQLSAGRSFTGVAPQLSPYLLQSRERKEDVVFVFEKGKPANIRAADPQKEAQSDRLAEEREAERAERQAEIAAKNAIATSERRSTDAAVGAKRANDTLLKTPRRSGPRDFRNPYNFVPAPEPPEDRKATALDRGAPVALDRWHKKLWSGCIRLRLTAATPLLLPEAPAVEETDGHKTFRTRREIRDDAEYPVLPVTSLKGVLRAACEAVTNSRFGAFDEHDRELGRRMPAEDGLRMVPARVTEGGLDLFMGPHGDSAWPTENKGRWSPPRSEMYAAWLPRYGERGREFHPRNARRGVNRQSAPDPEHGRKIRCMVQKVRRGPFSFWQVTDYIPYADDPAKLDRTARALEGGQYEPQGEPRLAWGHICVTNQNIGRKHDERVFFVFDEVEPVAADLTEDLKRRYELLVRDYRRLHEANWKSSRDPWVFEGRDIGKTAASRHSYEPGADTLKPGDLCYARIDGEGAIDGLYPVTISRDLYAAPPRTLLPDSLAPASSRDALSPADRMFGWTMERGDGGRRGQVRILPPTCETAEGIEAVPDGGSLSLAILGQPKPEQARFYAAVDRAGNAPADGTKPENLYHANMGLRGRKVYPHHRPVAGDRRYWSIAEAAAPKGWLVDGRPREYVRVGRVGQNDTIRDDQNRSIRDWVGIGTEFSVEIDVFNLDAAELGALFFALDPAPDAHLRVGGGRPLGFGSCSVDVEDTALFTGEAKQNQLRAFAVVSQSDPRAKEICLEAFREAVETLYGSFDDVPFIAAWRRATTGYNDSLPIHYPRLDEKPDPEGKNYDWFVRNAQGAPGRGQRRKPLLLSLAPLATDSGLVRDPTEE